MIVQAHRKVLTQMRSVIHEASTIAKAIEQGWIKAGKPKDFTIKIFEEPQKNFLGFTTKNAKVGIFIDERQQRHDNRPKKHVPQHRRQRHNRRQWTGQQERPFERSESPRHHEGHKPHGPHANEPRHEHPHDRHERPHHPKHQGPHEKPHHDHDGHKHPHGHGHDGHHDDDKE